MSVLLYVLCSSYDVRFCLVWPNCCLIVAVSMSAWLCVAAHPVTREVDHFNPKQSRESHSITLLLKQ